MGKKTDAKTGKQKDDGKVVKSGRLTNWDYKQICEWLMLEGNLASIIGSEKKLPVGKNPLTKTKAFQGMAKYINASLKKKKPIPIDGKSMAQRYMGYFNKYQAVKKASNSTGFGITNKDIANQITTTAQKLLSMCPHYDLMDFIFDKQPNVGSEQVKTMGLAGQPNVSTGLTSSDEEGSNSDDAGIEKPAEEIPMLPDDLPNSLHDIEVDRTDRHRQRAANHEREPTVKEGVGYGGSGPESPNATDGVVKSPEGQGKAGSGKKWKTPESTDKDNSTIGRKTNTKASFTALFDRSVDTICMSRDKFTEAYPVDKVNLLHFQREKLNIETEYRQSVLANDKEKEIARLQTQKDTKLAKLTNKKEDRELKYKMAILDAWKTSGQKDLLDLLMKGGSLPFSTQ